MENHSRKKISTKKTRKKRRIQNSVTTKRKKGKKRNKYIFFIAISTGDGSLPDEGEGLAGSAEQDADLGPDGDVLQPQRPGHASPPDHDGRAWEGEREGGR